MWDGARTHEIRKADRQFRVGDTLVLLEWTPDTGDYTGRVILAQVTWVTPPGSFGLPGDLCVMSVKTLAQRTSDPSALASIRPPG